MEKPVTVHAVGYHASSLLRQTVNGEEIVVVTIRPDAGSWRPHNVGFSRSEAERLLIDLQRLLTVGMVSVLTLLAGCSVRVETRDDIRVPTAVDHSRTVAVEIELAADTESETSEKPRLNEAVVVEPAAVTVVNVSGGIHVSEHYHTHVHFHEHPERIYPGQRPASTASPQQADPRCEQLRAEHEARVGAWQAMIKRTSEK